MSLDTTALRLQKKGRLADLQAKIKTLSAQADHQMILLLQHADTLSDVTDLDTESINLAADQLHQIATRARATKSQIDQLTAELYG